MLSNMTKRIKIIHFAFLSAFVSFLAHNMIYGILRKEEWFFFGLFFITVAAFLLLLFYSIIEFVIDREPADLWRIGFLGCFGLLGVIPGFSFLFCLFALFALFGLKDYF